MHLTLAALVLMPIVLLPNRYVGKATYRIRKQTQEKLSQMSSSMQEVLGISGILLVKALTKERTERHRFGDYERQFLAGQRQPGVPDLVPDRG